jgi:hypothetical protein
MIALVTAQRRILFEMLIRIYSMWLNNIVIEDRLTSVPGAAIA